MIQKFNKNLTFSKIKSIELTNNIDIFYNIMKKRNYIKQILLNKINDTETNIKRFIDSRNKKPIKFIKSNSLKEIKRRNISVKKSKSCEKIHILRSLNSFNNSGVKNLLENLNIKRYKSEINIKEKRNEQRKNSIFTLSKKKNIYIPLLDLKFKNDLSINSNKNLTPNTPSLIDIHSSMNNEIKGRKKSQSSINIIRNTLKTKLKEYEKENKSKKKNRILNNLISEKLYSIKKIKFKYNLEDDLNILKVKIKKKKMNKNVFEKIMNYEYEKRNKSIKSIKENLSNQVNKWSNHVALDYIDINSTVFKFKKKKNI